MTTVDTNELCPTPIDRSTWTLPTYLIPTRTEGNSTFRSMPTGFQNGHTADIEARLAFYDGPENIDELVADAVANKSPITVLKHSTNYLGTQGAFIRQGTAFAGSRGPAYLPIGHRSRGYVLEGVIDLITEKGQGPVNALAGRWYKGTRVPLTTELTLEDLKNATEANPVAAIYSHPGFDAGTDTVPGCVWIITEANDEIADGYLWTPPSHLCSEHGSTYVKDIVGIAALSLVAPRITFADCFSLPEDPKEAYQAIFGN
jgi:hypothetical protein